MVTDILAKDILLQWKLGQLDSFDIKNFLQVHIILLKMNMITDNFVKKRQFLLIDMHINCEHVEMNIIVKFRNYQSFCMIFYGLCTLNSAFFRNPNILIFQWFALHQNQCCIVLIVETGGTLIFQPKFELSSDLNSNYCSVAEMREMLMSIYIILTKL